MSLPSHDLHNHTIHCGHATAAATVTNLVAKASELGLGCLGLSEHVIFPQDVQRIEAIRGELHALGIPAADPSCDSSHRRHPPAQLFPVAPDSPAVTVAPALATRILLGVEIDPDPIRLDGSWVAPVEGIDYAILSPHRIPELGVGHWESAKLGLSDEKKRRLGEVWLDWYEACIEQAGFCILGHPLREPLTVGLLSLRDGRTLARAADLLTRAGSKGLAFELNDGMGHGLKELGQWEPYIELLRHVRSVGMKFTRGSDSHDPGQVGECEGVRALAEAGGVGAGDWFDPSAIGTAAAGAL